MFAMRGGAVAHAGNVASGSAMHSSSKLLRRASSQPCLLASSSSSSPTLAWTGALASRALREVQNAPTPTSLQPAAPVPRVPSSLFDLDDVDFFRIVTHSPASSRALGATKAAHAPFDRTNSGVTPNEIAPTQLRELLNNPVPRLLDACKPANAFEQQIAAVVKHLTTSGPTPSTRPSSPPPSPSRLISNALVESIATELLGMGFMVQIRDAAQEHNPERPKPAAPTILLSGAHHRFLTCTGCQSSPNHDPTYLTEPIIVELRFREHFVIQFNSAIPSYETLLMAVPNLFVGTLSRLETAVEVLSAEITRAFRLINRPLPPWRTHKAMMSRWLPDQLRSLSKLLAQSSTYGSSGAPAAASVPAVSTLPAASATFLLRRAGSGCPAPAAATVAAPPHAFPVCPSPRTPPATDGGGRHPQHSDSGTVSGPVSQADLLYYVERASPVAVCEVPAAEPEPAAPDGEQVSVSDPLSRLFARVLSGDLRALASRSRRCTGGLASALRTTQGPDSRHGSEGENYAAAAAALSATLSLPLPAGDGEGEEGSPPGPGAFASSPLLSRRAGAEAGAAVPALHQGLVPRLSLDLHHRQQQQQRYAEAEGPAYIDGGEGEHDWAALDAALDSAMSSLRSSGLVHPSAQKPWPRIHTVKLGAQPTP